MNCYNVKINNTNIIVKKSDVAATLSKDGVVSATTDDVVKVIRKLATETYNQKFPKRIEYQDPNPGSTIARSIEELTIHSGGAVGADMMFDKIGRELGVKRFNHYWAGNPNMRPSGGNIKLTEDQVAEGVAHMREAALILNRNPKKEDTINLLARNWFQVKNATQIVAIAGIAADKKTVEGGTGWAVAMAQATENKEINVFDINTNKWFQWNRDTQLFEVSGVPVLQRNFAGIGSRQKNNMTAQSIQAIKDVFNNTIESFKTLPALETESQSSNSLVKEIYSKLTSNNTGNVVVPFEKRGDYTYAAAVKYAQEVKGIVSTRPPSNPPYHYGNPFSSNKKLVQDQNLIQTKNVKESVENYINWILFSDDARAEWIRTQLQTGVLKGRPIIYYDNLNEPSHANALDYLINDYNWDDSINNTTATQNNSTVENSTIEDTTSEKKTEREYTPDNIVSLKSNEYFVFGANTLGRHGKGAALTAKDKFGAVLGQPSGLQGKSFAIRTKAYVQGKLLNFDQLTKDQQNQLLTMTSDDLHSLYNLAVENPDNKYYVTKIGTSLAGIPLSTIKGLFESLYEFYGDLPDNIVLPKEYEVRDKKINIASNINNIEEQIQKAKEDLTCD